jgi:hypothetical protein
LGLKTNLGFESSIIQVIQECGIYPVVPESLRRNTGEVKMKIVKEIGRKSEL